MDEKFMRDDFCASGSDLAEFQKTLKEVSEHTFIKKISTCDLTLLSLRQLQHQQNGTVIGLWKLPAGNPWIDKNNAGLQNCFLKTEKILSCGDFQGLIDEMVNTTKTMFLLNDEIYFASSNVFDSLGTRAGVRGDMLFEPCLERNLCIAKGLGKEANLKDNATLIGIQYNKCKKILYIPTEKYTYVPQTCLNDILKQLENSPLGEYTCKRWNIDHNITQIWIEFPEKAEELRQVYHLREELIPGLYLASSDTGKSALKAIGTWRVGTSISYDVAGFGENTQGTHGSRKHTGAIDAAAFCDKVDKEVFSKQKNLPEALCELMSLDITDPNWNLNFKKDIKKNREAVATAIKGCFAQIGMVAAIGKSREKELYELLCQELDPTIAYTAYDIAMTIMGLSGRVSGLSKTAEHNLAKVISKAPFCKFGKALNQQALVLTA